MRRMIVYAATVIGLPLLCGAGPTIAPAGSEPVLGWSQFDMDKTPSGIDFHGPFTNGTIVVDAEQLPQHDWLEINIGLFILRSWDGSVPIPASGTHEAVGPDFFSVHLEGGPMLLYTTFSNLRPEVPGFRDDSKTQNYPSPVPGEHLLPQSGSAEHNTLGYNYPWEGPPNLVPMDAVYHLRYLIPHHDASAAIDMTGMGLQNLIDESWGVRSVSVKPLRSSEVVQPDDTAITAAFDEALQITPDKHPEEAFVTLVTGGDKSADWIEQNVTPQPIDAKQVAKLMTDLGVGDDGIAERQAAMPALIAMGPQVEPYIRDAHRIAPGELRLRLDLIMQAIGDQQISDEKIRRVMLATRVLEIIGTPRALAVRAHLTEG